MTEPNPYQRWSGAPKHWVELPPVRPASRPAPGVRAAAALAWRHRDAVVTALALGAAVLLLALAGPGQPVTEQHTPRPTPSGRR